MELENKLNEFLADLNIFYRKLQNYHWNIEGKDFFQVHAKLEELYDEINEQIDEIAEHIAILGGQPLGTMKDYLEKSSIKEAENKKIKSEEIYNNIFISYDEAMKIVKTAINELCRKQGIVVSDLSLKINQEIWCSLEELNLQQLKRLEYELSKINNKTHKWHELYNQNSKIKVVVPENQEVVYRSSHYMFGQEALKQAGDDELLKGQIIDNYLELGTDLTKVVE